MKRYLPINGCLGNKFSLPENKNWQWIYWIVYWNKKMRMQIWLLLFFVHFTWIKEKHNKGLSHYCVDAGKKKKELGQRLINKQACVPLFMNKRCWVFNFESLNMVVKLIRKLEWRSEGGFFSFFLLQGEKVSYTTLVCKGNEVLLYINSVHSAYEGNLS